MKLGASYRPAPAAIAPLLARVRLSRMTVPTRADWWKLCPADGDALGNLQFGNCVSVADYQVMRARRANAWSDEWKPTSADTLARYARLTGFDLATGANDNGTDTTKDMTDWATHGIATTQALDIIHWVTVDPKSVLSLAVGIANLGPLLVTLALPTEAEDTSLWAKPPGNGAGWEIGSWGYHRVAVGAFEDQIRVVRTWGKDVTMHPDFWNRYVVAVDAGISWEFLDHTGLTPSGLNRDQLSADLEQLAHST